MAKRVSFPGRLLYFAVRLFFMLTRILPLSVVRRLGCLLADLAYYLVPRIRRIGFANLDIAYGDTLTTGEKRQILRGAVRNLGIVAAEFSRIPDVVAGGAAKWVTVRGFEMVDVSRRPLLMAAHHGNWEWMLPTTTSLGLKTGVIVRPFDNPRMDALVDRMRLAGGTKTVKKDGAITEMVEDIRQGRLATMLADQNPRTGGVPVNFFGRRAWTSIGPALIAMKAGVPVVPVSMVRDEKFHYTFQFYPAIEMRDTGNQLQDLVENTQRCQDALETIVRNNPDHWLWFHRRWRSRDRLEMEWKMRTGQADSPENKGVSPCCP